ncbi:TonB-dependent receptor plug domain-containing protein [Sphingobium algorifonticola]|uniref:TonB-dependent receptor plug domain-containing protein n=1 Tax=Sphingobium algorifonticola TaxID=2008318 RepID=UPI001F493D37|nr:TonB-dependent receptor [Sphingobium algorifonticola]
MAIAQTAPDTPVEETKSDADIIVTGSRIDRPGFDAPTPTTVLSAEDLKVGDRPTLAQALTDLPQFRIAGTPVTTTASSVSSSASIDLRGLGGNRTLTLLNGRRYIGSAELTTIPQALVGRVDVVTGGASAAWGSGAVAGVVNIGLNDKFKGLGLGISSGISSRGDTARYTFDATYGASFADGRGRFVIAGEYEREGGAGGRNGTERPNLDSALFQTATGQLILARDVNFIDAFPGGVIRSGPLTGQAFNPDGTLSPIVLGSQTNSNSTLGGNSRSLFDYIAVSSPYDRFNVFGRVTYEVADWATVWADGSYAQISAPDRESLAESIRASAVAGGFVMSIDNPYLRPEVRAQLAGGPSTFRLGRIIGDAGPLGHIRASGLRDYMDVAVGVDGEFGGSWRYSAYYNHGTIWNNDALGNQRIVANFNRAIDVVSSPTTGQPICRVALTDPTTACRPMNIFGEGNISREALAYAFGEARFRSVSKLDAVAASIRGEPLSLWAGPISVAFGVEARWESQSNTADQGSLDRIYSVVNYAPLAGSFNVKEVFAELLVPLVKNEGAIEVDLNGAARYSDYSNSGGIWTWKAGATARIASDILLRAVRSRDIRSPSIGELFTTRSSAIFNVSDPFRGNSVVAVFRFTGGNPALTPEIARTTTLGVTYSPRFLPGLRLSVDAFDIQIDDVIGGLSAQDIVTQCFNGDQRLCDATTRDANGVLTSVSATSLNLASYKTRGLDLEAAYTKTFSGDHRVSARALATFVDRLLIDDGVNVYDRAGDVGEVNFSMPKWRATGTIAYGTGPFDATLRVRYVDGGNYNSLLTIVNNKIASRTYVDLGFGVKVGNLDLGLQVNNLFDRDPPLVNYASPIYEVIGRYMSATARLKL